MAILLKLGNSILLKGSGYWLYLANAIFLASILKNIFICNLYLF